MTAVALSTSQKSEPAEELVAADLMRRGFQIWLPWGTARYDLVAARRDEFYRVQVKHARCDSTTRVIQVHLGSMIKGKGERQRFRKYTSAEIDFIATYCPDTKEVYYLRMSEFEGKSAAFLRIELPRNGQSNGISWARDYTEFEPVK
jgi:hypothetical protein